MVLVEVEVVEPVDVVESVAFLQAVELLVQDDPEGLPDDAVVDVLLGEAADPEVDAVDARHDLGPVGTVPEHDVRIGGHESRPLLGRREDEIRVGRLELGDDGVAQSVPGLEIRPGRIGAQVTREAHRLVDVGIGRRLQVGADLVERAEPDIPAAGHVEGEEVGVDPHQVVAHRVDDVEVDLLGSLRRDPGQDGVGPELGVARLRHVAGREGSGEGARVVRRVQEGVDELHLARLSVRSEHRQGLADQGMPDAIDRGREFLGDAGIHARVVAVEAMRAAPLDAADEMVGELGEDDALVFGLVEHLGGLEHLLGRSLEAGRHQVVDVEVVVACPDRVHGRQGDVLVRPSVAGHEVVEEAHEGVRVEEQGIPAAHEVGRHGADDAGVERARDRIDQGARRVIRDGEVRVVFPEAHRPAGQGGVVEDRVGVPMVLDQGTQGRQQVEGGIRRVRQSGQQVRAHAPVAVALAQELPDEFVRAIGLVLVDERRRLVEMLRHAVRVDGGHRAPGEVDGVVARRAAHRARAADLDGPVGGGLRQEIEPVVEVLAERHEGDVGAVGLMRQVGFLGSQRVADGARIEAVEERIQGVVADGRVEGAVMGVGQSDEGLVGGSEFRMRQVVAGPREVAHAGRAHGVVVAPGDGLPGDEGLDPGKIRVGEHEAAARTAAPVPGASVSGACVRRVPAVARAGPEGGRARTRESDAVGAVAQGRHAVGLGLGVVRPGGAGGQLDDVLRTQRSHDGVGAAAGPEHDPVGRGQPGDVDGVVPLGAVDGHGVEVQARRGEVADQEDAVARPRIGRRVRHRDRGGPDPDLLDLLQLGDDGGDGADAGPRGAGDDDLGAGAQRGDVVAGDLSPGGDREDPEGLGETERAVDHEGVSHGGLGPAPHHVAPVVAHEGDRAEYGATVPGHDVVARAGIDGVVAGPALDGVVARRPVDGVGAGTAVDEIVTGPGIHRVVAAVGEDPVGAGRAVNRVADTGVDDVVTDHLGRRREDALGIAALVGEAHRDTDLEPDLRLLRREGLAGRAGDVGPGPGGRQGLPLEGEGRGQAVQVGDAGDVRPDRRQFGRRGVVDGRRTGRRHVGEEHGPVRELRALDVVERIDAVRQLQGRGDDEAGVADLEAVVAEVGDGVVRPHVREDRGVDVGTLSGVDDLADDVELARVDRPGHQRRLQAHPAEVERSGAAREPGRSGEHLAREAVGGGHLGAGGVPDADPHVEPAVAVQDVVAGLGVERVAAGAAEQDVAAVLRVEHRGVGREAGEGGGVASGRLTADRAGRQLEQRLEAVDQGDVLGQQHAVGRRAVDDAGQAGAVRARWAFGPDQRVVVLPARGRLDRVVAVAQDERLLGDELGDAEVDETVVRVAFLDRPVEPEHAVVALDAGALDHDVVTGLAVVVGVVALSVEDVVADDHAVEEQLRILAGETVEALAALDPVVALVAHQGVAGTPAEDEIVAAPGEDLDRIGRVRDEVLAAAAEQDVEARAARDGVVALAAADELVAEGVLDDVVAVAAEDLIGFHAAVEIVVAAVAPEGVDALVADQAVVALGSAEDDVLAAAELQHPAVRTPVAVDVRPRRGANHLRVQDLQQQVVLRRVVLELLALVEFEDVVGAAEERPVEVRGALVAQIGVALDQGREGVGFELVEQVHALRTAEVVEAVAVLEVLHLRLEDEVEGVAQHPAEFHFLLGEAADPEIDVVQAGSRGVPLAPAGEEIEPIRGRHDGVRVGYQARRVVRHVDRDAEHQGGRRGALAREGALLRDDLVIAVGRDEVDHRGRVLDVLREVGPALIGLELGVGGHRVEFRAGLVERRHALFP